nr:hypothetical protein [Tanacetum cinerariifolium]
MAFVSSPAEENNNDQAEEEQLQDDEFTNPLCVPAQEEAESSSHNIENGNSFKPVAQTTTNDAGTSTTLIPGPVTTEKKNDVKARKNGNSFKPVAQTTTNDAGTSTTLIPGPVTTEKKNDVKARSLAVLSSLRPVFIKTALGAMFL